MSTRKKHREKLARKNGTHKNFIVLNLGNGSYYHTGGRWVYYRAEATLVTETEADALVNQYRMCIKEKVKA